MAFWIRNTTGGNVTVDDLGCTLAAAEERDLHEHFLFDSLQTSANLGELLTTGDLVRLDGPGGSTIPAADAFDDATSEHQLGGSAHTTTTLSELNALVSDATLDDSSDARAPTTHASSHLPGGGDALTTATPVTTQVGATAAEGTATNFARGDHQHGVGAAAPVAVGTANAEGTAITAARSDHVHAGLTRGANDFSTFANKGAPVGADLLLIEDSASAGIKSYVSISALPPTAPLSNTATATATITTTSTTDVLATGMTLTPAAGTYMVWFTTSASNATSNNIVYLSIYSGGTQVAASERRISTKSAGDIAGIACTARVTVNGAQTIEGRWRVGGSTGSMHQRALAIIKVS